jgi:guanylate kinase
MHKLYCIIGRTASGKSTITRLATEKLKMNVLKSYTTRKPRKGETAKNSDHIFILPKDVDSYRDDIGEDFITVELFGQEYVIDCVAHRKNYTDSPCSHITLKCRSGGEGEIKR